MRSTLQVTLAVWADMLVTDKHLAEFTRLSRPSEARPCCKLRPAGALQTKTRMLLNCLESTAASKLPWSAGKRALHVRDLQTDI